MRNKHYYAIVRNDRFTNLKDIKLVPLKTPFSLDKDFVMTRYELIKLSFKLFLFSIGVIK